MLVVGILYTIALWLAFFAFFEDKQDAYTRGIFVTVVFVLCSFVAFRPIGSDLDSYSYSMLYHNLREEFIEVSFAWIVFFIQHTFDDVRWLFIIYALLSVPLHAAAIRKLSPEVLLSVLLWLSHYFLIQDFTQIRVAVASGFMLVGLPYLIEGKRWKFLLFLLMALFFHYSSAAFLPLLFFGNKKLKLKGKLFMGGLIVFAYALYFAKVNLLTTIPIPYFQNKLDSYQELRDAGILGDNINVFNVVFLLRLVVFYYSLVKYEFIVKRHPAFTLLIKVYTLSLFSYVGLSVIPTIAGRMSELYGFVEVAMYPMLVCTIQPKFMGRLIFVLYALGLLSLNIWHNNMINLI